MTPETRFINRVHRNLKKQDKYPYFEKNHNSYRGGTPDVFYSGTLECLWVEYKWWTKLPTHTRKLSVTPLQKQWILRRREEGRQVWVCVGHPGGVILFANNNDFTGSVSREQIEILNMPFDQYVKTLINLTGGFSTHQQGA